MESYLFLTIGGRIWRTTRADVGGAWEEIAHEIGRGRRHVHEIVLARGWPAGEMLVGTARENPGGAGVPGTGAEVWRGSDYGSRWEQLAADGFGNPNTGAVPVLAVFRGVWGGVHVYASALNHPDGSTVYKRDASGRWEQMPYGPALLASAPIRSMASFGGRLFIGEGNNPSGAGLFYTVSGFGWGRDRYDFSGSAGEFAALFACVDSRLRRPAIPLCRRRVPFRCGRENLAARSGFVGFRDQYALSGDACGFAFPMAMADCSIPSETGAAKASVRSALRCQVPNSSRVVRSALVTAMRVVAVNAPRCRCSA
jgi:hypothetical protein